MTALPRTGIQVVAGRHAAEQLVHPLRQAILEHAVEPMSATDLGETLGEPRQKINYHVHELEEVGLLAPAGTRAVRNLTEKLYQATAKAYVLSPETLGAVAPTLEQATDRFSADTLLALTARSQAEVGQVLAQAEAEGSRVATLSLGSTVHFESAEQRAAFTRALQEAVVQVVEEHTSPEGPGTRPFRLVTVSHPVPRDTGTEQDEGGSR